MKLEGVGVTQSARHGPFQLRLKFGKQAYCVIECGRAMTRRRSLASCASWPSRWSGSLHDPLRALAFQHVPAGSLTRSAMPLVPLLRPALSASLLVSA
jgi:hypothetical protein